MLNVNIVSSPDAGNRVVTEYMDEVQMSTKLVAMLVKLIVACIARMWLADNILLQNHKTLIGRSTPIISQLRPPLVR